MRIDESGCHTQPMTAGWVPAALLLCACSWGDADPEQALPKPPLSQTSSPSTSPDAATATPLPAIGVPVKDASQIATGLAVNVNGITVNQLGDIFIQWRSPASDPVCPGHSRALTWIGATGETWSWRVRGSIWRVHPTATGFVLGPTDCDLSIRRQVVEVDKHGRSRVLDRVAPRASVPIDDLVEYLRDGPSTTWQVYVDTKRNQTWEVGPWNRPRAIRYVDSFEAFDDNGLVWRQGYPMDPRYEDDPNNLKYRVEWWPVGHREQRRVHTVDFNAQVMRRAGEVVALVDRSIISFTRDEGSTWQLQRVPRRMTWFVTESGHLISALPDPQRSSDEAWTRFETFQPPNGFRSKAALLQVTGDVVWVVDHWRHPSRIALSRDEGESWTEIELAQRLGLPSIPDRSQ